VKYQVICIKYRIIIICSVNTGIQIWDLKHVSLLMKHPVSFIIVHSS
jgi:hypothetical protein